MAAVNANRGFDISIHESGWRKYAFNIVRTLSPKGTHAIPYGARAVPLPVLGPLKVVALRVKRPGRCDPVPRPPPGVSRAPPPVARQVCSNRLVFEPTSGHLRAIEPSPPITGLNKHHTYARNRRWFDEQAAAGRRQLLVVGDSLGDLRCAEGVPDSFVVSRPSPSPSPSPAS